MRSVVKGLNKPTQLATPCFERTPSPTTRTATHLHCISLRSQQLGASVTCRVESGVTYKQEYNAENRISSIWKLASGTCAEPGPLTDKWDFTYDGDGVRTGQLHTLYTNGQVSSSETTRYFFGGAYETTNGAWKKYYSFGGTTLMRDATGFKYFLSDHLGSVAVVLSATGTILEQQRYLPFGEARIMPPYASVTSTDFTYTGQRNLDGTGLMDYKARFYSSYLNRFIQPDMVIPDQTNPQNWNRYSYVTNQPLNLIDPSGHKPCRSDYLCERRAEKLMKTEQTVNSNADLYLPTFTGEGWTKEEMIAITVAYNLAIKEFGGMDNFLDAFGGPLTFEHVPAGSLGQDSNGNDYPVMGGSRTIKVDSAAFAARGNKMTWYTLHEMGHTFDFAGSKGPKDYKSQVFVDAFSPGCSVTTGVGCSGSNWKPSDTDTTKYGLTNSVEDFADSFASTILLNSGAGDPSPMTYRDVGSHRQIIINNWILYYVH